MGIDGSDGHGRSAGALDRRTFLKGSLGAVWLAGGGGLLAACGGSDSGGGSGGSRPPISQEKGDLQVFEWSGYEKPMFWQAYKQQHPDNAPKFTFFANDDEAITKVRSGFKTDLAHPCSGRLRDWVDAGLVEEIDTSKLKNFSSLNPVLVEAGKVHGKQYWIPWDWGFSSLIYNPEVVSGEEDTWRLMWDAANKGKVSLWDNPTTALRIGGLYVGVEDVYDMTDAELDEVKKALIAQKKVNRSYWTAEADMVSDFASGNLVVTNGWTSAYLALKAKNVPVAFGRPREGRLAFNCGFVIVKGTPRYYLAHAWIDAYIGRRPMADLANDYGYGYSNTKATPLVKQDRRSVFELSDPDVLKPPKTWLDGYFPRRDKYIKVWDEVKAA